MNACRSAIGRDRKNRKAGGPAKRRVDRGERGWIGVRRHDHLRLRGNGRCNQVALRMVADDDRQLRVIRQYVGQKDSEKRREISPA